MNCIIFSCERHHFWVLLLCDIWHLRSACLPHVLCVSLFPSCTPSICVFPLAFAHLSSDPQGSERVEAERSDQGLQFHLPLSFRHKPPRIALQAVKDR